MSAWAVISLPDGKREFFSPMGLDLNLKRLREEGLIDYSNQGGVYLVQPTQDGIDMADAVQERTKSEQVISSEQVSPDPAQTARAQTRSDSLDRMLSTHQEWTSDTDIAANGGPSYESVVRAAVPVVGRNGPASAPTGGKPLSDRDVRVHEIIGRERFNSLANVEIMRDRTVKKPLRAQGLDPGSDAAKNCLDRIRNAKGYPLSREVVKKRANRN